MDLDRDVLAVLDPHLRACLSSPQWFVALSGGRDSAVLLDAICRWRSDQTSPPVIAIHVHHGLHSDADDWQALCQAQCDKQGIPLESIRVQVPRDSGLGPEASARIARYGAFKDLLSVGDTVFTAHHGDDQAETVLYRLLRGSGPRGLAGMPRSRPLGSGHIMRPMLDVTRAEISDWASRHQLSFVDDPSNTDVSLDRNFIRREVLPILESRWPGARDAIRRAGMLQRETLSELDAHPLPLCLNRFHEEGLALEGFADPQPLATALHRWLTRSGCLSPPRERLLEYARQLLTAAPDRHPELLLDSQKLRRWRGAVWQILDETAADLPETLQVGEALPGPWGRMDWHTAPAGSPGLRAGEALTVRYREEGDRVTPLGGITRGFKQRCQESDIPPWWRHRLPVLLAGGDVVAVPGFGALTLPMAISASGSTKADETVLIPFWIAPATPSSIERDALDC